MAYINNIEGRLLEPMAPTTTNKGGIYAQTVQDTTGMQEVVVGSDGKAYVNNDYSSLVHNIVGEVEEEESEE